MLNRMPHHDRSRELNSSTPNLRCYFDSRHVLHYPFRIESGQTAALYSSREMRDCEMSNFTSLLGIWSCQTIHFQLYSSPVRIDPDTHVSPVTVRN